MALSEPNFSGVCPGAFSPIWRTLITVKRHCTTESIYSQAILLLKADHIQEGRSVPAALISPEQPVPVPPMANACGITRLDGKPCMPGGPLQYFAPGQKDCQSQNQDSNPESVPLHAIPPVIPPLRERPGMGLVKDLLQNNKTVVPERKILYLAVACPQMATFYDPRIEFGRWRNRLNPFSGSCVRLWEEEGKRSEGLLDESVGENGATPISWRFIPCANQTQIQYRLLLLLVF